jgi:hypothetical protein
MSLVTSIPELLYHVLKLRREFFPPTHWRTTGNQKDCILVHQRKYFIEVTGGRCSALGVD